MEFLSEMWLFLYFQNMFIERFTRYIVVQKSYSFVCYCVRDLFRLVHENKMKLIANQWPILDSENHNYVFN